MRCAVVAVDADYYYIHFENGKKDKEIENKMSKFSKESTFMHNHTYTYITKSYINGFNGIEKWMNVDLCF